MFNKDYESIKKEGIAELYLAIFPYICKDFIYKDDLKNALAEVIEDTSLLENVQNALNRIISNQKKYDAGDDPSKIVKPLIEL